MENGKIVIFGIMFSEFNIGYGYIKVEVGFDFVCFVVVFVEKLDFEWVEEFLKDGSYVWNVGIFFYFVVIMIEVF